MAVATWLHLVLARQVVPIVQAMVVAALVVLVHLLLEERLATSVMEPRNAGLAVETEPTSIR